jgi:hypothetical protein
VGKLLLLHNFALEVPTSDILNNRVAFINTLRQRLSVAKEKNRELAAELSRAQSIYSR